MRLTSLAAIAALILVAGCGGVSPAPPRQHAPSAGGQALPGQTAGGSIHPPGWGQQHAPQTQQLLLAPDSTATMYDSITLDTIPAGPFALAGYTSGFWPSYGPMRRRWPSAHTVSIAVTARYHADCLDVEPGDATPAEVPGWVRADMQAGFTRPCVYSSYFEFVTEVRPALARAGIPRSSVWEWDADYTYRAHIDAGFDGTQWTDVAFGRNLDASLVTRGFLSIAQPPLVAPKPNPKPGPTPGQRAALRAAEAKRAVLRRTLIHFGCRQRVRQREPLGPRCLAWFGQGRAVNRTIARLNAEGVT